MGRLSAIKVQSELEFNSQGDIGTGPQVSMISMLG